MLKSLPRICFLLLATLSLTGCMVIDNNQNIKSDGSTHMTTTISMDPGLALMMAQNENNDQKPFEDFCDNFGSDETGKQTVISCETTDKYARGVASYSAGYYTVRDAGDRWIFTFPEDWKGMVDDTAQEAAKEDNSQEEAGIAMLKAMGFKIQSQLTFPGKVLKHNFGTLGESQNILIISIEDFISIDKMVGTPVVEIAKSLSNNTPTATTQPSITRKTLNRRPRINRRAYRSDRPSRIRNSSQRSITRRYRSSGRISSQRNTTKKLTTNLERRGSNRYRSYRRTPRRSYNRRTIRPSSSSQLVPTY